MDTPIEKLLPWSEPKEVTTKRGPRLLRKAPATNDFWNLWRSHKPQLKEAGVSCSKDNETGAWEVCWWQEVPGAADKVAASRATDADVDLPAPDGLDYLPYQRAGIEYALGNRNCLIADEMGLGKTIQAIGVLNARPQEKTVLVICPASLKLNWQREIEKWCVHNREVQIIKNGKWNDKFTGKVTIVNFELCKKLLPLFQRGTFDRVVVDESHRLKNEKAASTKAVLGYWDRSKNQNVPGIGADSWIFLTGTPILNRPVELWTTLRKCDPDGLGRSFMRFVSRYCAAYRDRYGLNTRGASNLDELQLHLRQKFMVRRKKSEVLKELPDKVRQVIPLAANGKQKLVDQEWDLRNRSAEAMADLTYAREMAKADESKAAYESAVAALRDEIQVLFTEMAKVRQELALEKLPAVIEHLEDSVSEDNPVIVFAWHKAVIDALHKAFDGSRVIDGRTSQVARQRNVDGFQAGEYNLLVGNIKAAGVGLTLTRSAHVVFAELDWVPANLSQAEDRCHRIGQEESVLVQHMVVEGSLDAEMAARCIEKQRVADKALDIVSGLEAEVPIDQPATVDIDWAAVGREAEELDSDLAEAVHVGLKMLARVCDGAVQDDAMGFNALDTRIGRSLAREETLSKRQTVLGRKILFKYHRQLPEEINERIRTKDD